MQARPRFPHDFAHRWIQGAYTQADVAIWREHWGLQLPACLLMFPSASIPSLQAGLSIRWYSKLVFQTTGPLTCRSNGLYSLQSMVARILWQRLQSHGIITTQAQHNDVPVMQPACSSANLSSRCHTHAGRQHPRNSPRHWQTAICFSTRTALLQDCIHAVLDSRLHQGHPWP